MKKYYKRIKKEGSGLYKKGVIYPEDHIAFLFSVRDLAKSYPEMWQEVSEMDYLLQVAKEKYKEGVVFNSPRGYHKNVVSDGAFCVLEDSPDMIFCGNIAVYNEGEWAEIVEPKTITDYENETMMEKEMTHEEAIKNLKLAKNTTTLIPIINAIDKAIANMEQFRKFDEPVEMEVSNSAYSYAFKANILGKFDGKYLGFNGVTWKHARPIKPKVLSKNKWAKKHLKGSGSMPLEFIDYESIDEEYQQYLNDNK